MHYIMSFLKNPKKSKKWNLASIHTTLKEKNKNKTSFINTSPWCCKKKYIIIIIFFFNSFIHTFIFFSRLKTKDCIHSFMHTLYILKKIIKEIWDSFIHLGLHTFIHFSWNLFLCKVSCIIHVLSYKYHTLHS